ncbi:hypothetical protein JHV56_01065 [Arthrobacter sp. BHU FT2]|nr:hypothetical protein [Arthrobacter sp. BHU FT2]
MPAHCTRTPFHFLRASALATGILTLAAGAHAAAGGQLPAPGILLAILALTGLASTAATRLKLSFSAMAGIMGGAQVALHELFTVFSTAAGPAGTSLPAAHQHGLPAFPPDLTSLAGHLGPADPAAAPLMMAAHTVATLGCALLLAKGEAALWALAAWLRPFASLPEPSQPAPAVPAVQAFPSPAAPRPPWRNLRQDSRRGPPSAVVLPS